MILIRSLFYELFFVLSIVVYASLILVLKPVLSFNRIARLLRHWARVNLAALKVICGLCYRVQGLEHLPREAGVVLCKHQSTWETIALRALMPPEHTWVLKRELLSVPFFGWVLRAIKPIAIDRAEGTRSIKQLLRDGKAALEQGRWVVVFPEGTRVAPGEQRPYAVGGAVLASRAGRVIVPVAHNAGLFWRRRALRKLPGTIDLVFGEPIDTQGQSAEALNAQAQHWIETQVSELETRARATERVLP